MPADAHLLGPHLLNGCYYGGLAAEEAGSPPSLDVKQGEPTSVHWSSRRSGKEDPQRICAALALDSGLMADKVAKDKPLVRR